MESQRGRRGEGIKTINRQVNLEYGICDVDRIFITRDSLLISHTDNTQTVLFILM